MIFEAEIEDREFLEVLEKLDDWKTRICTFFASGILPYELNNSYRR